MVNPKLITNSNTNIKTSLKTIEPHSLRALIIEDVRLHPDSLKKEIKERLPDVEVSDIQKNLYALVDEKVLTISGGKTYRKYRLA
jgi:ATP-dependent DNA helicase RecG